MEDDIYNTQISFVDDRPAGVSSQGDQITTLQADVSAINTYQDLDFGRLTMSRVEQNKNRIYIPFYQYPDFAEVISSQFVNDLQTLLDLADENPNIPIICTINPQNGPGDQVDGQYTKFFKRLRAHNIDVNGYIYSGGRSDSPDSDGTGLIPTTPIVGTEKGYLRDPENFRGDLLEWFEYYPLITGIFIDEWPFLGWEGDPNTSLTFPKDICGNDSPWNTFTTQGEVNAYTNQLFRAHYSQLYLIVKEESKRVLNRYLTVVGNPGVQSENLYSNSIFEHSGDRSSVAFDLIMDWENSVYPNFTTIEGAEYLGSIKHYNKSSRIAVVHSQASFDPVSFRKLLKYYGSVYITSDELPNPFDNLSQSYITEMAKIINENSYTVDLSNSITDVSGRLTDVSNSLTDVSGRLTDVSNSLTDVSGRLTDLSNNVYSKTEIDDRFGITRFKTTSESTGEATLADTAASVNVVDWRTTLTDDEKDVCTAGILQYRYENYYFSGGTYNKNIRVNVRLSTIITYGGSTGATDHRHTYNDTLTRITGRDDFIDDTIVVSFPIPSGSAYVDIEIDISRVDDVAGSLDVPYKLSDISLTLI